MLLFIDLPKKRMRLIFFFLFQIALVFAQAPAGYYTTTTLDGKNTNDLRQAFKTIITTNHNVSTYAAIWTAFGQADMTSNNTVWDMYSNCTWTYQTNQCGNYVNECDCYNREHVVPSSWFGDNTPMYNDLVHLVPTDGKVNGIRANYPYGKVNTPTSTTGNGSKLGQNVFPGYSGIVFEPVDEYKGDFARIYFYMATRYADVCSAWGNGVFGNNLGLTNYGIALFLEWSRNDPVSAKETERNNAIFAHQNNRNPYVDFPGLEEFIWGNQTAQAFYVIPPMVPQGPTILAGNPISTGQTLQFGQTQTSITKNLYVKTQGATAALSVQLSGNGFSSSVTQIPQFDANQGIFLPIVFQPSSNGTFQGTLIISGGGIPTYQINLNGTGN